jgi:hypothetical protein
MNLQKQLSIKSALRFALPGLASCLLLAACSNEVSDNNPENLPSDAAGTIRFSASAPLTSEDVATRIGIGEGKPSVANFEDDEPVIWLGDEEISVFFVNAAGDELHAKFVVDAGSVSPDGKSADLLNETNLSQLNGEYTIYAFTPYVAGNTLEAAQLNFSNQVQEPNTSNYSHLGATASMRALGGNATFANGVLSGDVTFNFEHVTSFLRFFISNGTGDPITVTGITVSHPNMVASSTYNIKTDQQNRNQPASISLTFGDGITLADKGSFDAYLSTLNVPLTDNYNQELEITVSVEDGEPFSYSVLPVHLKYTSSDVMFLEGTRFLFDISLELSADSNDDFGSNSVTLDGYVYTYDKVTPGTPVTMYNNQIFVATSIYASACPANMTPVDISGMSLTQDELIYLYVSLGSGFRGYLHPNFGITGTTSVYTMTTTGDIRRLRSDGLIASVSIEDASFRPLCRKKL